MLTVAIPKRNKLQNIIVLTPKDGPFYLNYSGRHREKQLSRRKKPCFPVPSVQSFQTVKFLLKFPLFPPDSSLNFPLAPDIIPVFRS